MAPVCTNCNGTDFVWANDLKTGSMGAGLSLRSRGEVPLGARICRTCGHAELFLRDLSILHQPHHWRPGEFVPIVTKPVAKPPEHHHDPPPPAPPALAPAPAVAPAPMPPPPPEAPSAPPAPPVAEAVPPPTATEETADPVSGGEGSTVAGPAPEAAAAPTRPRSARRRTTRSKS